MELRIIALLLTIMSVTSAKQQTSELLADGSLPEYRSGYINPHDPNPVASLIAKLTRNQTPLNKVAPEDFESAGKGCCWKHTIGRGVGRPIHSCPSNKEKDAGLCYDFCRDGYTGVGPVCWEDCRSGYTDTGAFCTKPGKIISADNDDCAWYDVCGLTFDKGCSHCPDGYKNDGCTCRIDPHTYTKDSYGRGVGKPMGCADHEEYDAGLCYDPCPETNYDGVGPVCWQQCPNAKPSDWGALCCSGSTKRNANNALLLDASRAAVTAVASEVESKGLKPSQINQIKKLIEEIKAVIEKYGAFSVITTCLRFTLIGN